MYPTYKTSFVILADGREGTRIEFLEPHRGYDDRSDKHVHHHVPCRKGEMILSVYRALPNVPFLPRLFDHDVRDRNWFTFEYLGETHVPIEVFLIRNRIHASTLIHASLEAVFEALFQKGFYFEDFDIRQIFVEKATGQIKLTDLSEISRVEVEEETDVYPLAKAKGSFVTHSIHRAIQSILEA